MPPHPVAPLARAALLAAGGTAAVAVVVGGIAAGRPGVYGALLGAAISVLFVGITLLIGRLTLGADPNVMMSAAMGSFLAKLVVFYVALQAAKAAGLFAHVQPLVFALTAVAVAVATMVAEALAFLRARRPVWDGDAVRAP